MRTITGVHNGDIVVEEGDDFELHGVLEGLVLIHGGHADLNGTVNGTVRVTGGSAAVSGVVAALNVDGGSVRLAGVVGSVRHRGGTLLIAERSVIGAQWLVNGSWERIPQPSPRFTIDENSAQYDANEVGLPRR